MMIFPPGQGHLLWKVVRAPPFQELFISTFFLLFFFFINLLLSHNFIE